MKKKSLLALSLAVTIVFAACSSGQSSESSIVPPVESLSDSSMGENMGATSSPMDESNLRLGLGIVSRNTDSIAAGENTLGNAKNLTVVCAVAVDENDVIRKIKFDSVKNNLEFDAKGMFTGDINEPVKTKKEMGYDYGLAKTSDIKKEWFEQISTFENWAMGKTVTDVAALELDENNIPMLEELKTGITIDVSDQIAALKKAYEDARAMA